MMLLIIPFEVIIKVFLLSVISFQKGVKQAATTLLLKMLGR